MIAPPWVVETLCDGDTHAVDAGEDEGTAPSFRDWYRIGADGVVRLR